MSNPMMFKQLSPKKLNTMNSSNINPTTLCNEHFATSQTVEASKKSEIKIMSPQNSKNKKRWPSGIQGSFANIINEVKKKFSSHAKSPDLLTSSRNGLRGAKTLGDERSSYLEKERFLPIFDPSNLSQIPETKRELELPSSRKVHTQEDISTSSRLNINDEDAKGPISTVRQNLLSRNPSIQKFDSYLELRNSLTKTKSEEIRIDEEVPQLTRRQPSYPLRQEQPVIEENEAGSSAETKHDENINDEDVFCRICKDDDSEGKLATPCDCKGSIAYAHSFCLQKWIESKAAQSSLSCEICRVPYRIVARRLIQKQPLVDFIKNPQNRSLNYSLLIAFILAIASLIGTTSSLSQTINSTDKTINIIQYILITIFGMIVISVIFYYLNKTVIEDWEFVRKPRGKELTMKMVSKKNHWQTIIIDEQSSVTSQQNNSNYTVGENPRSP